MSVDTEDKRRSVSGYSNTVIYPVAAGAIDAADRAQVQWLYAGLAYGPPTPPAPPIPSTGDAAALIGFGGGGVRRYYWREKVDPWETIRAWLRSLRGDDKQEWKVNVEAAREKQARDIEMVTRLTHLSRKRRRRS